MARERTTQTRRPIGTSTLEGLSVTQASVAGVALVDHRLSIRLKHAASAAAVKVATPFVKVSRKLSSELAQRKGKRRTLTLTFRVNATNASGHITALVMRFKLHVR